MDLFLSEHTKLIPIHIFGYDFSISDFALSIVGAPLLISVISYLIVRNLAYYPGKIQSFLEIAYETLHDAIAENLSSKGEKYINFLMSMMIFILFLNLANLIPGFFSCTSQFAVTFSLSGMVFILLLFVGIREYKFGIWRLFLPEGLPMFLKPLMFLLELLTFLIRPIALALRLTINVLAGHTMLNVISSFANNTNIFGQLFITLFSAVLCMFEIGVAVLQAYIFVVLSSIYISEILDSHH
jgi:F-type H+-transporting ATPase subunit a